MQDPSKQQASSTLARHGVGGAAIVTGLGIARSAYAAGSDEITLAMVGCGGRGRGAAVEALNNASMPNVRLVAVADAFQDAVDVSLSAIEQRCPGKVDVPPERRFVGLDGYRHAIEAADMVLLCEPPGFRPRSFEAAVNAGKMVFAEKPVATDAPGVRRVMKANEKAKAKGLPVAVGHHLRHEVKHLEAIKQLHAGAIGDLRFIRIYFNSSGVWTRPRREGQTEMEHQVSNWYYFTWLSGDHIVEQHVHDIDVMNWMAQELHPVSANGMGGRQVRISRDHGEIFDHHSVEFTFKSGVTGFSVCRHQPNTWGSFSEHAHGTKGVISIDGHGRAVMNALGQDPVIWQRGPDGHQLEHDNLFAAIRDGRPYNEMDYSAASTMTAILGRMATYSGKTVTWDEALASEVDLSPDGWDWNGTPQPKPGPDGIYPCAIPGRTKAV